MLPTPVVLDPVRCLESLAINLFGHVLPKPRGAGRKLLQGDQEDDNDVNDDSDNSSPAPSTSGNSVLDAARQRSSLSVFYRAASNAGLNGDSGSSLLLTPSQPTKVEFEQLTIAVTC